MDTELRPEIVEELKELASTAILEMANTDTPSEVLKKYFQIAFKFGMSEANIERVKG